MRDRLEKLFDVEAELGAPLTLGPGPVGERRMIPITGGRVSGRLSGVLLPGGADWQVLRSDGISDIDARYLIRADSGALVEVRSRGIRHGPPEVMARLARGEPVEPGAYYFRTTMRFETMEPALGWLARTLAVAFGERQPDTVRLEVFGIV